MRSYQGFLGLLLLVDSTALTTKRRQRGWHCSGPVTEYTNRYCGDQGPIEGCYFVDNFDQYRSCGLLCNNVIAPSIDEDKCNAECTGFLVRYCTLDWLHTSPPPTTTVTSIDPSTTSTGFYGAPVVGTANSEPDSIQLRKILLSVLIPLGFILLVGVIIGVWWYRKRRPAQRENDSVDHTETGALNGDPPTSRAPPPSSQEERPGTSSGEYSSRVRMCTITSINPEQELHNDQDITIEVTSPPEDEKSLVRGQQANEDDT